MRKNRIGKAWCLILLVLFPIGVLLPGCGRVSQRESDDGMTMRLAVDPDPPLFGRPCQMSITIVDRNGAPVEGAALQIKGDMTHAGMVPVIVETSQGADGIYTVPFDWTMAGDWIVTVVASPIGAEPFQRQFELTVQMPGG